MVQKRNYSREYMDDLTMRDQSMIFSIIIIVHTVDSLNQLDTDTESLISVDKEHLCDASGICYQQEDELNSALPYGLMYFRFSLRMNAKPWGLRTQLPFRGYNPQRNIL